MALVADGWHMGTHAAALAISALAYRYARRHARDPRFAFGTGKLGDLAGFASAIVLAMVALLIGYESVVRLVHPVPIAYGEAIAIAVRRARGQPPSAWLLGDGHHDHGHDHDHHATTNTPPPRPRPQPARGLRPRPGRRRDLGPGDRRPAAAGLFGWAFMDPVIGLVGTGVIVAGPGAWSATPAPCCSTPSPTGARRHHPGNCSRSGRPGERPAPLAGRAGP